LSLSRQNTQGYSAFYSDTHAKTETENKRGPHALLHSSPHLSKIHAREQRALYAAPVEFGAVSPTYCYVFYFQNNEKRFSVKNN